MTPSRLRERFGQIAQEETQRIFAADPCTREFHRGKWLTRAYYKLYLSEYVRRIYANNQADTYLTYRLGGQDIWLAREFSAYLAEEWWHDEFLIADLKLLGVARENIRAQPLLLSTSRLMAYLYSVVDGEGPIANVVWNWYQQWYSDEFDPVLIRAAATQFGEACARGAEKHMRAHIDAINRVAGPAHYADTLFAAAERLVGSSRDLANAERHLRQVIHLFGGFLHELSARTGEETAVERSPAGQLVAALC